MIKKEKIKFLTMTVIICGGLFISLFIIDDDIALIFTIVPLLIIIFQFFRIFKRKMIYKNWINGELGVSTVLFINIGIGIRLFGYALAIGKWFWMAIIPLSIFIILLISYLIKFTIFRLSFVSDKRTLDDIEKNLKRKDIYFSVSKINKIPFIIEHNKKAYYLPDFGCKVFKNKEDLVIRPDSYRVKDKVYEIIDIIEK